MMSKSLKTNSFLMFLTDKDWFWLTIMMPVNSSKYLAYLICLIEVGSVLRDDRGQMI